MAIEIKELHIKINVEDKTKDFDSELELKKDETMKIIKTCVEQVMEILSKNQER